jgi:hypothetical protein
MIPLSLFLPVRRRPAIFRRSIIPTLVPQIATSNFGGLGNDIINIGTITNTINIINNLHT